MSIVRELVTRLGFKVDKKAVSNAENVMAGLKRAAIGLAGAFAVGKVASGLSNLIQETAALGDTIDKVSAKLGIGAQALQELRFAGEQTGVATKTMDMALQRFIRRSAEAAAGTGEAKDALKQMNIQLKDAQGNLRPAEELFGDVAEAMKNTASDGERLRLAFKLFDSEGVALVNTLKGGRDALNELRQAAVLTGGIMTDELIASSVEFTDSMGTMALVMRGVKNIVATELLPRFTAGAKGIIEWVMANRALIAQNIGDFFRRSADFVENLIDFFLDGVASISKFISSLSPLESALAKVGLAIAAIGLLLALPFGGFILLAGAIALIIDDFQTWKKGGDSVIGAIIAKIDELLERFPMLDDAIRAVSDAFDFIKDAFKEASEFIEDVLVNGFAAAFESRSDEMLEVANVMAKGIEGVWASMLDAMEKGLVALWEFFASGGAKQALTAIDDFAGEAVVAANRMVKGIEDAWFEMLRTMLVAAGEFIESAFVSALEALGAGLVAMWEFFVTGGAEQALQTVIGFFMEAFDTMTAFLGDSVEAWAELFFGVGDEARSLFESIASAFRTTWESLTDFLTTTVQLLAGILGTLVGFWIDIFEGKFQQAFVGVFENIKQFAIEVFGLVTRQLKNVAKLALKIGDIAVGIGDIAVGFFGDDEEPAQRRGARPPPKSRRQPAPVAPTPEPDQPQGSAAAAGRASFPASTPLSAPAVEPLASFTAPGIEVVTSESVAAPDAKPFAAPGVQPVMMSRPEPRPLPPALVAGARVLATTDSTGVMPAPVAGPVASSTSTVNTINNRNRANVNVSVQATPGMDEGKLADLVSKRVETAIGDTMRGAMDDVGLIPEAG